MQHLPASFTEAFAARLDRACRPRIAEAVDGEPLERGRVYIAPGGRHLSIKGSGAPRCWLSDADPVQGHRPSVDVMMLSVAATLGGNATGVVLTGMGRDGASGLLAMRRRGARTIVQDEATSLVYGMPRVAAEIGAADLSVPLDAVTREIFAPRTADKNARARRARSAALQTPFSEEVPWLSKLISRS